MNIEIKKKLVKKWFILLRDIICYEIEELEKEFAVKKKGKPKKFKSQVWKKSNNDDDLKEMYKDYHQEEFKITYVMKHRPDNKQKKELLVCNYDINKSPLEAIYA